MLLVMVMLVAMVVVAAAGRGGAAAAAEGHPAQLAAFVHYDLKTRAHHKPGNLKLDPVPTTMRDLFPLSQRVPQQ